MKALVTAILCALVTVFFASARALAADEVGPLVIASWEKEGEPVKSEGKAVAEQATDGTHSLKVESDGQGYMGLAIEDGATLRKFRDYVLLKVDVFNPQDAPVHCGARIDDAKSTSYGTRYNNDNLVVPPGKSTIEINLTGLTKSNARNFDARDRVDLETLKLVNFWISPVGKPVTLFFDNLRLEGAGLPKVEGLRAFDFGPVGAPVFPGFEGCTDKAVYNADRGYGWAGPDLATIAYTPDALTGDCVSGKEFRLNLPNGSYEVNLCWDMFGLWHTLPSYTWRKLAINGKTVIDEKLTGKEFLDKFYYAHEDDEDLPGQDLWEKFIASYQKIHRFTAEVTDGVLKIEPQSDQGMGRGICFLVVYPEAKKDEGAKFMETLNARRKAKFNAEMVVNVPKAAGEEVKPTDADKARGFIAWVANTEDDIAVTARPPKDAPKKIVVEAAQGERVAAQVGIFPLADMKALSVSVAASIGGNQWVSMRQVRNFLKREGSTRMGNLLPYMLVQGGQLKFNKSSTRAIWLTIDVPGDAKPGKYDGAVQVLVTPQGVAADKIELAAIPIELTVLPFKLDKIDDITISVTGSTAGTFTTFHPDLKNRWWEVAEIVMKDQAEHGMNAITGGPGARLKGVKDGKAHIDYTDMDRWMALAVKYGLTMPGDSYQGLDVSGIPQDHSKDCVAKCEAAAKSQYGVSYAELLRIVYGDLEQHAKAKGWPKRVYYFLDEPRPEYGNVEPCAELIKTRTKACPDTLFSGYYSTGQGRDVYYQTMPVSIGHTDKLSLDLVKKAGKQLWDYSGSRVRHDIGRWAFVAARAGLKGFLRNGYFYVNSMPYFDFSDDEASWSCVYPSKNGINDTVGWERTAQGVNDYRYLLTCERLIKKAREARKAAAEADAAEAYMKETLKAVTIEDKNSAHLTGPQYDEFRRTIAGHIIALNKAIGN
ncbi:MAG: glycoside hydrolase domain-containing protein [Phycisphaerae bacterium]